MRARHRHFNPRDAGANVALDARFGFSLSDNSDVDTWEDRSINNNDASQATAANKPKYRTNIQGGQPSIEFMPSTNTTWLIGNNTITNNLITIFALYLMNSESGLYGRVVSCTKDSQSDHTSTTRVVPLLRNGGGNNNSTWRSGVLANISTATVGNWYHFTNTFDGTNCVNRLNETTSATSSSSGNFDINKYWLGAESSATSVGALKGYIAGVSIFNSNVKAPLRKRIQFSNAYSFKIACS